MDALKAPHHRSRGQRPRYANNKEAEHDGSQPRWKLARLRRNEVRNNAGALRPRVAVRAISS